MKAMELALLPNDCWRKIAITLVDKLLVQSDKGQIGRGYLNRDWGLGVVEYPRGENDPEFSERRIGSDFTDRSTWRFHSQSLTCSELRYSQ
jgi:hypothetical protein